MSNNLSLSVSHAQKGIWLGQQKLADSPCYNTSEILSFEGDIDIARLIRSAATVLAKVAALNMLFRHGEHGLEQYYTPSLDKHLIEPFDIQSAIFSELTCQTDITSVNPKSTALNAQIICFSDDDLFKSWVEYWLTSSIDLTKERPFRHAFIRRSDGKFAWFLQIHHIACDGFSYALLSKQLKLAYENNEFPDEKTLQKALSDYKSLINTTNTYETSEQCEIDRTYWQSQFSNHHPISLKASALNDTQPAIAHREYIPLTSGFLAAIKRLAKDIHNDWPSLLKACVAKWLNHAAGISKITFGCPEMNRPFGPAMRVPALQMNIQPVTVELDQQASLLDIAKSFQLQQQSHKPHSRYRYEHFASDVKRDAVSAQASQRPFGPIINILPFDRSLTIDHCHVEVKPLAAGPVEDIAIYFAMADNDELKAFIEFHPALYKQEECYWLCQNFSSWLNDAINNGYQTLPIPHPSMSIIAVPSDITTKSLFEQLEYYRVNFGHKPALNWFDETLPEPNWQCINYQALCTYIADTAQTFAQAGLHKGQKCVIAGGRDPWSIISMFACLALNAEFIGVDIDGPSHRLTTIMQDCQPRLVVVNHASWLTDKTIDLPAHASVLTIEHIERLARRSKIATNEAMAVFIQNASPTLTAYSIYTSGSTSQPKAVQISQQALIDFIASANHIYQITHDDHVLQFAPLHFDACIEEIFISLCHGATLSIRSKAMVESFSAFNSALTELGITFLDLPTAFWHEWVRFNTDNQVTPSASITRVIIGGEASKSAAIADFFKTNHSIKLINTYGPSEATVVATSKVLGQHNWRDAHPATIGQPLPGRAIVIVDEKLNPLPKGVAGQLALGGNSLANGYYGQPDLTAEKFVTTDIAGTLTALYLTGDIAAISEANEVIFYGRADDEIKISGQRIHPAEISTAIESLLVGHQAAILPLKKATQYQLVAVIAHENYRNFQPHSQSNALKAALADKLPAVQIPSVIFEMPKLPLTSAGKVDRKQLTGLITEQLNQMPPLQSNLQTQAIDKTSSATLHKIIAVWQEILSLNTINAEDDFFVLGGTSLQLLQVATRLTQKFKQSAHRIDVTVSVLFKYPRAVDLARHIDTQANNTAGEPDVFAKKQAMTKSFTPSQLLPELRYRFRPRACAQNEHILLTGATGFVGTQLLSALLEHKNRCEVTCLIRARSTEEAKQKIARACADQQLVDISLSSRLHIELGDLAHDDWGLSTDELQRIAKPLTAVIHNGAATSIVRDYQSLKAINVDATQTAMKIAHLAGAPLHYISTIAISDRTLLPEDFIAQHDDLLDGYQQSKWASENLLEQRAHFNQPLSIYRLPRVVGDSSTGAINSKDLIWQIAAASTRARALPELPFTEPWLPANEAASFIVARVFSQHSGIYNCVPEDHVSIKHVLKEIAKLSSLTLLPLAHWQDLINQSDRSEDQALFAFFNGLKDKEAAPLPAIANQHFKASATSRALAAPKLDAYLNTAINLGIIHLNSTPKESTTPRQSVMESA